MTDQKYKRAYAPAWEALKKHRMIEITCEQQNYRTIKEMISEEKHRDKTYKHNKYHRRLQFFPQTKEIDGETVIVGMIIRLVDRKNVRLDEL